MRTCEALSFRRAADQGDEFAPPHYSITSSARASSIGGTSGTNRVRGDQRVEHHPMSVKVVGYVGADAHVHVCEVEPKHLEKIELLLFATASTVALEIRDSDLGVKLPGWFVLYDDDRRPPTQGMVGQLCVVGNKDGRIAVEQLRPDHASILRAAAVKGIAPRQYRKISQRSAAGSNRKTTAGG